MEEFGILVLGYARPKLLENTLESLNRQDACGIAHVWIDGTASRKELSKEAGRSVEAAKKYPVREIRSHNGHLGIEKMMIDALSDMVSRYEKILVLEDDCFPTANAVAVFRKTLDEVAADPTLFSAYGHPFGVEPESRRLSRFQGWGWGTSAGKLSSFLPELRDLFNLAEHRYLEFVHASLTPDLIERLDKTPPRNVVNTMKWQFSWDSALALLSARAGLEHLLTPKRVIYNCGITPGMGHFGKQKNLRSSPFNMIKPNEVWKVYDK